MREGGRWGHGNEKHSHADKPKQDIQNRVRTACSDRTKAGAFLEEIRAKILGTDLNTDGWTCVPGSKKPLCGAVR